ncbi:DUF5071 domain-containing protein [Massilia pseudoviolaceinigra]|uniref:DUF5071 domain-containing protein n=1 Tax=Massilia pseudoviolaceinigra TaxID=3057165 RepID=UPI0027964976|nr:DUF5071 domain-containing protein [Massilia sp. CCM 9206]MDQ1919645.1 DUF5071 domain-containing protein [Massilia sp. CCM 9206]
MHQRSPFIPADKHDLDAVQAAMAAGWPAVAPVVPDLLVWMQDLNWPVAKELAPLLVSLGAPLAPAIRQILDGDDGIWKHNLIDRVVARSPALLQALAADLHRLAAHPTASDRAEEVDVEAREALLLL